MAHATGTTLRSQRLTALVAIVAVAMAVGLAFGRVLVGHSATYRMIAVAVASGLLAWATERRGMLLATACSVAGLLLALTWLVAADTTWSGAPTLETLRVLGSFAAEVGQQAREQISPATPTPPLVLAGVVAVWAAVFSCYALAFRAQSPLLGLVPPLALVAFADGVLDELVKPAYGIAFLVAALAVLFADSLRRIQGWGPAWSPSGARRWLLRATGRGARRIGATAVVAGALAPMLLPGFGGRAIVDWGAINSDGRVRLSPLVSIGGFLTDQEEKVVFTVEAERPSYWRMIVLDAFSGTTWEATQDTGAPVVSGQVLDVPTAAGEAITQTVRVEEDQGFVWLPAAANPVSITIDGDVTWHPASSSLQVSEWLDAGDTYEVTSVVPTPAPSALRTVGLATQGASMTALPDGIPSVVRETAELWTESAATEFDKVTAIQRHLTSAPFVYEEDVAYRDDPQTLADVLTTTHEGMCQQYASLMAVMLRSIGIPARVAYGFTQGRSLEDASGWVVTTKDLHSWVEVPFQGYGWLSFEPTPGAFRNPASVSYLSSDTGGSQCPPGVIQCGRPGSGGQEPIEAVRGPVKGGQLNEEVGPAPSFTTPPSQEPRSPLPIPLRLLLAVGGVLAVAIPLWRRARRATHLHAARGARNRILATYDVLGERAGELGWGRRRGETPHEYLRRLDAAGILGERAGSGLERLTTSVARAAYAADEPQPDDAARAHEDADSVVRDLRHATSLATRVTGLYRRP